MPRSGGAWRRFLRHRPGVVGAAILLVVVAVAAAAPWIAPYPPDRIDLANANGPPSLAHPLGTDAIGRDIASRLIHGSRVSVAVGLAVAVGTLLVGATVGAVAGYWGGWVDAVLMRLVDGLLSIPSLFLHILVLTLFGAPLGSLILVLVLTGWMDMARLVRGQMLQLRAMPYVDAARALGVPTGRIIVHHLLRNAAPPLLVHGSLRVGSAILAESALSFLGFGVQPPQTSWGQMLNEARPRILTEPMAAVYPGLCILITVMAVQLVGDGLREALDPRWAPRPFREAQSGALGRWCR